jgi:hypothetical protein
MNVWAWVGRCLADCLEWIVKIAVNCGHLGQQTDYDGTGAFTVRCLDCGEVLHTGSGDEHSKRYEC